MPFALTPALVPSRASRRAHATRGGDTSTPRSLSTSSVAGEHEVAPAHPLGLLCVQNGYVVSVPRWIQPSEEGVEIGALATGEGGITDDVSARHAHIWCDAQNIWHVEDLSSTNGTMVVNGATNVCIQVEPGRSAQLNPGDELRLGESTLRYPPRRRRPLVGRWGRSFYAGTPGHSMARQSQSPGDEGFILALGGHPR